MSTRQIARRRHKDLQHKRRQRAQHRRRLLFESLETRRLLSATDSLEGYWQIEAVYNNDEGQPLTLGLDFGDAPANYSTTLAHDGARHATVGPTLGSLRDGEGDAATPLDGTGDDGTGASDEDGVTFGSPIRVGQLGATVMVNVQHAPDGAKLDAWLDFNADGSWGGPLEHIANNVAVVNGDNTIAFDVPSWAVDGTTYARFRLSTAGNLAATGEAADGEVEDCQVTIVRPLISSGSFGAENAITQSADWARSVFAADVNSDGLMDLLSASDWDDSIIWYENDGNSNFTEHLISGSALGAYSVFATDMDGDGDTDVLSASYRDNKVAWYENDGQENFTAHTISTTAYSAVGVYAADVNSDGHMDVLAVADAGHTVAWYENDGHQTFIEHVITDTAAGAYGVLAADVDGDGAMDVVSVARRAATAKIVWWQNDGNDNFNERVIPTTGHSAVSVAAMDIDRDGDIDLVSAALTDGGGPSQIAWHENVGGQFVEHVVSTVPNGPDCVVVVDLNGDGRPDLLSASHRDNKIIWYENVGQEVFVDHTISTTAQHALCVTAADLDGDGDLDVASASARDYKIAWYENLGPRFDFGDAPADYGTTLARDGARHVIAGPFFGAVPDAEVDGQPSADALGDDNDGGDDEEGVTFTGPLLLGAEANVDVDMTASPVGGFLNAWIDFNGDGDWADAGEQVFTDVAVTAGVVNSLAFSVPIDAMPGERFSRFRVSTAAALSPTGLATDGEVEDHTVTIVGGEIHGMKWDDRDGDGAFDPDDGETGLPGWTIYLDLNNNGSMDPAERDNWSTVTTTDDPETPEDETGTFVFTGLPPGRYVVAEVPMPGWRQTHPVASGDYQATSLPFHFEDISDTGNVGMAPYVGMGYFELAAADLAGFEFDFYGSTYDRVFASSNGLITFGSGETSFSNTDLTTSPNQAAIAVLWDDLVVSSSESPDAAILWEVLGSGDDQRLILQWHEIPYSGGAGEGAITFQAILSESDGSIQFNYLDLQTTGSRSEGASATVGIKDVGLQGDNRLLLAHNSGPNEYVGSGQSVRISSAVGPVPHVVTVGHGEVLEDINFGNRRMDAERQIVSGPASVSAPAGRPLQFGVRYDTSTGDSTLTGLALRLHYDSSFLGFHELTDVLATNFIAQQGPMDDVEDFDGDPSTDQYVLIAWSDPLGGNWPNETLPLDLLKAHFHFAQGLEVGATTNINFSGSSTAAGYGFDGSSVPAIVAPPVSLDVDDNGTADALTDGVLILRHLFGFTGEELVNDAIGSGAGRSDPGDIGQFLDGGRVTMLDPDDNGVADALTDGVVILRYLFGFRGEELVRGATGSGANRSDPDEIVDFLRTYLPSSSAVTTMRSSLGGSVTPSTVSSLSATMERLVSGEGEPPTNVQLVTPAPESQTIAGGDQVNFDVTYTTSPEDPASTGLGLRMHFDSAALSFEALSNVLGTNLVAQQAPQADTPDYDNDPSTDQFVLIAWSDPFGGNWPGALPALLCTATFTAAADFVDETSVNFSASSSAAGFDFAGTSALIRAESGAPTELLQLRLETTDLEGNPISSVVEGDRFLLRGHVEDLRPDPAGVFGAYTDVTFDPNIVTVSGGLTYGGNYPNVQEGETSAAGLIDEVGAVADLTPLGSGEFLLFSVPLLAAAQGRATFVADPADLLPHHQSLLFGQDDPVLASQIIYGTTTIDVLPAVIARGDSATVDEDSVVDVPVLANDVGQNLTIIAFDTESEHGAIVTDNGDGTVRYDARSSAGSQALASGEVLVDSFTYAVLDAHGTASTATVTVTVEGVNDAPAVANPILDQLVMPTLRFSLTIPDDTFVDLEHDSLSYAATGLPTWLTFDPETRTFNGTPTVADVGEFTIEVTATDIGEPRLTATDVFSIAVYNPYQNPDDARDVNADGVVSPIDVLIVINELNRNGSRRLPIPPEPPLVPPPYPDVNSDLHVSPIDALWVINCLNERPSGEGELAISQVNSDAADRLFSGTSESAYQTGAVPLLPVIGSSGDSASWTRQASRAKQRSWTAELDKSQANRTPISPRQADAALRVDGEWDQGAALEFNLAIDLSLEKVFSDMARS